MLSIPHTACCHAWFAVDLPPGVQFSNFFFAYICKKQPLQLPQHQGQKGQLPNGWVAGSKELFSK